MCCMVSGTFSVSASVCVVPHMACVLRDFVFSGAVFELWLSCSFLLMNVMNIWINSQSRFSLFPFLENIRDDQWSIEEANGKFRQHSWKRSFNLEGVNLNEITLKRHYRERFPEEIGYATRYDLTFLSPCWHQLRCKVWHHSDHFWLLPKTKTKHIRWTAVLRLTVWIFWKIYSY